MPPSADDLPGRRPPARKERRAGRAQHKRSRGKQPGSPGAAMRWRRPDEVVPHFPEGACACGPDLAGAADLGVFRSYRRPAACSTCRRRRWCRCWVTCAGAASTLPAWPSGRGRPRVRCGALAVVHVPGGQAGPGDEPAHPVTAAKQNGHGSQDRRALTGEPSSAVDRVRAITRRSSCL